MVEILLVLTSLAGLAAAVVGLWKVWYGVHRLHVQLNSRLDEMIENITEAEFAKGKLEGEQERRSKYKSTEEEKGKS